MSHILEFADVDWHILTDEMGVFVSHYPCTGSTERGDVSRVKLGYYPYSWLPESYGERDIPLCVWCQQVVPDSIQALVRLRLWR